MYKKHLTNAQVVVVISSYNRGEKISETITSLLKQTHPVNRIIVIDDGSEIGKRIPKFNDTRIHVISLKKNVGVVWGRNLGLSKIEGSDYVLLIDDDISLEKNAIARLLLAFEDQKDIVAAMPVVYFLKHRTKVWSSGSGVNLLTGQTLFDTKKFASKNHEIEAATSVLLTKTEYIKKSGWYDPLYYFCYEDVDFYYRLKEKNSGKIYSVREASAYHDILENLSLDRVAKRSYHIGRGRVLFLSRHSSFFPLNLVSVLAFSVYYFYIGVKFGDPAAGLRYILGFLDGLTLWLGGKSNVNQTIDFKYDLSLSKMKKPAHLKSTKVRE